MGFRYFFIVCLLIGFLPHAVASPVDLNVDLSTSNIMLGPHLSYFEDASSILDLQDVFQRDESEDWQRIDDEVVSLGLSNSVFWFRIVLSNVSAQPAEKLLEVPYPMLNEVHSFQLVDGVVIQEHILGNEIPFSNRPINHRNLIFPIVIPPNKTMEIYFRVKSDYSIFFPITLWEVHDFLEHDQVFLMLQALFFGLLAAIVIYNVFVAWGTKEKAYLLYVCLVLSIMFGQAIFHGLAYQFIWRNFTDWNSISLTVTLAVGNVFVGLFVGEMLQIKKSLPWAYLLLKVFIGWSVLVALMVFFLPNYLIIMILGVSNFFQACAVLVIFFACWARAESEVKVFIIAWLGYLGGSILMALNKFNVIPYNVITENALQIGSALEAILLSFVLTIRINSLRKETVNAKLESKEMRRRVLKEKEEGRARVQFLAMMSHEIRTPMNGVLGLVDVLKETSLDVKQQRLVGVIQTSGEMLLNVINDILDFSKADANSLQLELLPVDTAQLLDECMAVYGGVAKQKGLLLTLHHDKRIPELIESDSVRLKQVLSNLLANAIKFTKSGHVCLRTTMSGENEATRILFEVEDSGIGLSVDQQENLFVPFSQADRSITREFGGTGLGLAISKKIVDLLGGDIGVSSEVGVGSTFWFDMPISSAVNELTEPNIIIDRKISVEEGTELLPTRVRGLKVLIAEDNTINQMVIKGIVSPMVSEVKIVNNGLEAVEAISKDRSYFDLVLMDCEMPIMDGFEAVKNIRESERTHGQSPLKIVALTAHALAEYREKAFASGMDDHLTKPVNKRYLQEFFRKHYS